MGTGTRPVMDLQEPPGLSIFRASRHALSETCCSHLVGWVRRFLDTCLSVFRGGKAAEMALTDYLMDPGVEVGGFSPNGGEAPQR